MKESANRIAKPYVKMNISKEEGLVQIEHISILRGEPAIFFPDECSFVNIFFHKWLNKYLFINYICDLREQAA